MPRAAESNSDPFTKSHATESAAVGSAEPPVPDSPIWRGNRPAGIRGRDLAGARPSTGPARGCEDLRGTHFLERGDKSVLGCRSSVVRRAESAGRFDAATLLAFGVAGARFDRCRYAQQ